MGEQVELMVAINNNTHIAHILPDIAGASLMGQSGGHDTCLKVIN